MNLDLTFLRKSVAVLLAAGYAFSVSAQTADSFKIAGIEYFRDSLNTEYRDPAESPLTPKELKQFEGLEFFPVNLDYYITAEFVRTPGQPPFKMATTTTRSPIYEKYGEAHFSLHGKEIVLNIYQSHELRETEKYRKYFFLPFRDETNGEETYGGGRYLGLWMHQDAPDSIVVDFNKAYNPYCVYNVKYSCPLVPKSNWMEVAIPAGVKDFKKQK